MRARLEINLTMRCQISCKWCNRLIANMKIPDSDVTLNQLHLMADSLKKHKIKMKYIKVLGGEPLVHYDFLGAMNVLKERILDEGIAKSVNIVTNAILDRPKLPDDRFHYWLSPVKEKQHIPVLASPTDLGLEDQMRDVCITKKRCGFSFDAWGFSFCPISGVLGRVLGIDTYRDSIPESKLDKNICKHCPFGLPVGLKKQITKGVKNKSIDYPSKTWKEGLARELESPMEFEKFGGDNSYHDDYGEEDPSIKELVQLDVL